MLRLTSLGYLIVASSRHWPLGPKKPTFPSKESLQLFAHADVSGSGRKVLVSSSSWGLLFSMKFLDAERLLRLAVAALLSAYGRPDPSSLRHGLLFSCGWINTFTVSRAQGCGWAQGIDFHRGLLRTKSGTNVLYGSWPKVLVLGFFDICHSRCSTQNCCLLPSVIDKNSKKFWYKPAASFAGHAPGALYAPPRNHLGSKIGMLSPHATSHKRSPNIIHSVT